MWNVKVNYQNRNISKSSWVEAPSEAVVTHTPNMRSFHRHWLQPQLAVLCCPVVLDDISIGKSHMQKMSQYDSCKKWVCTRIQLEHAVFSIPIHTKSMTRCKQKPWQQHWIRCFSWITNGRAILIHGKVRNLCPKSLTEPFRDTVKVTKILKQTPKVNLCRLI